MGTAVYFNGGIYVKTSYTPANWKDYTDIYGNLITYHDEAASPEEWQFVSMQDIHASNVYVSTDALLKYTDDPATKAIIEGARWETTSAPKPLSWLDVFLLQLKAKFGLLANQSMANWIKWILWIIVIIFAFRLIIKSLFKKGR